MLLPASSVRTRASPNTVLVRTVVSGALMATPPEQLAQIRAEAAKVFGLDSPDSVTDAYLLGIKNIQAETLEYKNRVTAEGEAVSARLEAEGDALLAKVQGEYETKLNALFGSPAGRAYVAWKAAGKVSFAKELTFSSQDGIPARSSTCTPPTSTRSGTAVAGSRKSGSEPSSGWMPRPARSRRRSFRTRGRSSPPITA